MTRACIGIAQLLNMILIYNAEPCRVSVLRTPAKLGETSKALIRDNESPVGISKDVIADAA